jgi:hypothetical protein
MVTKRDRPTEISLLEQESGSETTGVVYLVPADDAGVGGIDVERINAYGFYSVGQNLKGIHDHTGNVPLAEAFWVLHHCRQTMTKLIAGDPVPLGFALSRAHRLQQQITLMWNQYFIVKNDKGENEFQYPKDDAPPIYQYEWTNLRTALSDFETVFSDAMTEAATYFVPRRGIFQTSALVDKADESFPAEIRGFIPDKAKLDWQAAGRCLAFNLLTASGFHVARAVEGTLEAYYQLFSGKRGKELPSWHEYIQALEQLSSSRGAIKPSAKTVAELQQMKNDYRNPIAHPRVVLTEPEARILFDNGESLIIAMAQEIGAFKETESARPTLLSPPDETAA